MMDKFVVEDLPVFRHEITSDAKIIAAFKGVSLPKPLEDNSLDKLLLRSSAYTIEIDELAFNIPKQFEEIAKTESLRRLFAWQGKLGSVCIEVSTTKRFNLHDLRSMNEKVSLQEYAESIIENIVLPKLLNPEETQEHLIFASAPYNKRTDL